jgi:cyclic beta-1,2-glucan synthetase
MKDTITKSLIEWIEHFPFSLLIIAGIFFIFFIVLIAVRLRNTKRLSRIYKHKEVINNALNTRECIQHLKTLANQHQTKNLKHTVVLSHLNHLLYKNLKKIRNNLENVSSTIISLIPAARWLFDNFYMFSKEIKKIQDYGSIHRDLPILTKGKFKGFPRIYAIWWWWIQ